MPSRLIVVDTRHALVVDASLFVVDASLFVIDASLFVVDDNVRQQDVEPF